MADKEKDIFADENFGEQSEVTSNTVDWGKVGDFLAGTFVKARHEVETQFGMNSIYEFSAEKGQFHKKDGSEVNVNKGESWAVWGRNDLFNAQMDNLRPGQVVKLQFVETKPSKMGNEAKIIKLYAPKNNDGSVVMNQTWLDAQEVTAGDLKGM